MMHYDYSGETHAVTLQPLGDGAYRATIGDRSYVVMAAAVEGGWMLEMGENGRQRAFAAAQGDRRHIFVGSDSYLLTVVDENRRNRDARGQRRVAADSGELFSAMPGQVLDVKVAAGDSVQRGQTLIILEAMKMEIRVTAPADGQVKQMLVNVGDLVERGQKLAEIAVSA